MAPQVPALAQSESKARFFARLGLDPTNGTHRRVYNLMKMEAAEGRKRLLEGQAMSTAQIHEYAWQREVLRIYHDAQPQTRAVYQFGHDTADPNAPDNWIIRWMLWHVFRYRDYRNKQQRQANGTGSGDDDDEHSSDLLSPPDSESSRKGSTSSTAASSTQAGQDSLGPSRTYWDPVRDQ
ncbi:hypothetical protein BST61_g10409 [Cercospora zeina]